MKLAYSEIVALVAANNRSGQDTDLIVAMCYKESGFDPAVRTRVAGSSAAGLMGVTRTAISEVNRVDKTVLTYAQVQDAATNIEMGSRYLRIMVSRFTSIASALDHYGTGPGYSTNLLAGAAALKNAQDPMAVLVRQIGPR